ncbi:hypothetical protein [Christiangramia sabulilitoris]|uniref:Sensor of ECF-type sigma factor n=1 Tax=Christiangramia sabulilitoris TaxID=2583991 RepID=A0A550I6U6_9FLAO|nr:hypothetical protein [Christiangramia sabulilitoris]TRO66681.1 hypothetical protein FGM01_01990 [Christiangramia sabulilitoris]
MKNLILIICFLFTAFSMGAQEENKEEQRERIKALKVAYFTQELKLNEKTAEKFWPIYNEYERERRELHRREHIELKNVECISENEAEDLIDEFLSVESEEYKIKKQLFKDLKQIISAKDIIKLHKLEDEFHKKLIKEYRSKREKKDSNSSE